MFFKARVAAWLQADGLRTRLLMQVHDELVLEVPEDEIAVVSEKLPLLMAQAGNLKVPLVAEVGMGMNWDEAH